MIPKITEVNDSILVGTKLGNRRYSIYGVVETKYIKEEGNKYIVVKRRIIPASTKEELVGTILGKHRLKRSSVVVVDKDMNVISDNRLICIDSNKKCDIDFNIVDANINNDRRYGIVGISEIVVKGDSIKAIERYKGKFEVTIEDVGIMYNSNSLELSNGATHRLDVPNYMEDLCNVGITDVMYRIRCVYSVCSIDLVDDCYELLSTRIPKQVVDSYINKIEFIRMGVTKESSKVCCYDIRRNEIIEVTEEDCAKLEYVGMIASSYESCIAKSCSNVEWFPLTNGKFIRKDGYIGTYEEMKEYYINKYGYFVDLYKVDDTSVDYAGYDEDVNEINIFIHSEILLPNRYSVKDLTNGLLDRCKVEKDCGIYNVGYGLYIKEDVFKEDVVDWVVLERLRGNTIYVKNRRIVFMDIAKDVAISGIEAITEDYRLIHIADDATVDIRCDISESINIPARLRVHSKVTLMSIYKRQSYIRVRKNFRVEYYGTIDYDVVVGKYLYLKDVLGEYNIDFDVADKVELKGSGILSYEETYRVTREIWKHCRPKKVFKEFIERTLEDKVSYFDMDAIIDIYRDQTGSAYKKSL